MRERSLDTYLVVFEVSVSTIELKMLRTIFQAATSLDDLFQAYTNVLSRANSPLGPTQKNIADQQISSKWLTDHLQKPDALPRCLRDFIALASI